MSLAMEGRIAELDSAPVVTAFLTGLLQTATERRVSMVNAGAIARELGLTVDVRADAAADSFGAALRVAGGRTSLAGTIAFGGPRIVSIDGFETDAVPSGSLLLTRHADVPGMIGKVGTILGADAVNISAMQVGRHAAGGDALMILAIDRPAEEATLERLRAIQGVSSVRALDV
jgi:D-3-phosphoglycerate dehydrogenase